MLAFVAESVNDRRKGFQLLLAALEHLKARKNLFLLAVGQSYPLPVNVPSLQVGRVENVVFLRQIYSAADVFVIPSLEDNQPNTVLESMACGTPVVGFNVGGIQEMVEHGRTGLLAPAGDVQQLTQAIEHLLDHNAERIEMAANARKRVEEKFSRQEQVRGYLDLYERLLPMSGSKTLRNRPELQSARPVPAPIHATIQDVITTVSDHRRAAYPFS